MSSNCIDCGHRVTRFAMTADVRPPRCAGCQMISEITDEQTRELVRQTMRRTGAIGDGT